MFRSLLLTMSDSYFSEAEAEEWSFLDFYKHRRCQIDFTKSFKKESFILKKNLEYLVTTGSEKAKSLLDAFKASNTFPSRNCNEIYPKATHD
ncbi:hypothetical protein Glove_248g37 [Diversispora epigaea]|uniref:Uncharacterized protein n=1 Tax=Diversispora epigaea TaxID=1348612 RepID=A0A397I8P2_9GLOM|nr:hypothetical protein Glove_248g37 [Diversispora epigaea]